MKKLLLLALFMVSSCSAILKYNDYTGKHEFVPESWELRYNHEEGEWAFAPMDAILVFNKEQNKWTWDCDYSWELDYDANWIEEYSNESPGIQELNKQADAEKEAKE